MPVLATAFAWYSGHYLVQSLLQLLSLVSNDWVFDVVARIEQLIYVAVVIRFVTSPLVLVISHQWCVFKLALRFRSRVSRRLWSIRLLRVILKSKPSSVGLTMTCPCCLLAIIA